MGALDIQGSTGGQTSATASGAATGTAGGNVFNFATRPASVTLADVPGYVWAVGVGVIILVIAAVYWLARRRV